MKNLILNTAIISCLIAFALCGCKTEGDSSGCGDTLINRHGLTYHKDAIPYTGRDTLTFLRTTQGDTHTFISYGKYEYKTYIKGTSGAGGGCPYKDEMDNVEIRFYSTTTSQAIVLNMYYNVKKDILLGINFNSQNFNDYIAYINNNSIDIDSLKILNKYYKAILILSAATGYKQIDTSGHYYSYYTLADGIVRMKFKNGETWDLLERK